LWDELGRKNGQDRKGMIYGATRRARTLHHGRRRSYPTGKKIPAKEMRALTIERDEFHGEWNYVIRPRKAP
jgi:DDE family transposase